MLPHKSSSCTGGTSATTLPTDLTMHGLVPRRVLCNLGMPRSVSDPPPLDFVRAQRPLAAKLQCRPLQQHRTRKGAAEIRPQGVVSHGSSPQPTIVEVYTHLPLRAVLRSIPYVDTAGTNLVKPMATAGSMGCGREGSTGGSTGGTLHLC
jgi:hypothetical protein